MSIFSLPSIIFALALILMLLIAPNVDPLLSPALSMVGAGLVGVAALLFLRRIFFDS